MITLKELLMNRIEFKQLPQDQQSNIMGLLEKINKIRSSYGKPMTVSSGYRSMEDHLRIYKQKGITNIKLIPMKSNHLYGNAVDIADPKQELQKWVLNNVKLLEQIGLWCEDFSATKTWVHFQQIPPKSGKRFFMP